MYLHVYMYQRPISANNPLSQQTLPIYSLSATPGEQPTIFVFVSPYRHERALSFYSPATPNEQRGMSKYHTTTIITTTARQYTSDGENNSVMQTIDLTNPEHLAEWSVVCCNLLQVVDLMARCADIVDGVGGFGKNSRVLWARRSIQCDIFRPMATNACCKWQK